MTGKVTKVVIHFGKGRTSTIRPGGAVQAIFLDDAANRFVIRRKHGGRPVKRREIREPPAGVTIRPWNDKRPMGPRGVCYMVSGVQNCWRED
jgi:hypothetical protein